MVSDSNTNHLLTWKGHCPSVLWLPGLSAQSATCNWVCCQPGFPSDPVQCWCQPSQGSRASPGKELKT